MDVDTILRLIEGHFDELEWADKGITYVQYVEADKAVYIDTESASYVVTVAVQS